MQKNTMPVVPVEPDRPLSSPWDAFAGLLTNRIAKLCTNGFGLRLFIHIDGAAWTGKSSLLKLLRFKLEPDWLIVSLNGRREERHGRQPILAMLRTFRQVLRDELRWHARARMWTAEVRMWLKNAGTPYFVALFLLAVLSSVVFLLLRPDNLTIKTVRSAAETITAIASAVAIVWGGAILAARLLVSGSSKKSQVDKETEQPIITHMETLDIRLRSLRKVARRPVLFQVDDLEKCKPPYVVELLDALKTLIREAPRVTAEPEQPVVVIVAGDGRWIRHCFEEAYIGSKYGVTPGRSREYVLMEELFDLTIPMPSPSYASHVEYIQRLVDESGLKPEAEKLKERLTASITEAELLETLQQAGDQLRPQLADAAMARLTSPEVRAAVEHSLMKFAPILPPNPRELKRFVEMYSIARAVCLLEGRDATSQVLALWTILRIEWPALADYLRESPEMVEFVGSKPDDLPDSIPIQLRDLFYDPRVERLVYFPHGGPLTSDLIRTCA